MNPTIRISEYPDHFPTALTNANTGYPDCSPRFTRGEPQGMRNISTKHK